jgi:CBS domain-containing protein
MPAADAAAAVHAFHALQAVRLAAQAAAVAAGKAPGNQIDPETLNEFDRRLLLEALRQARSLQQRLKTRFHIDT